MAVVFLPCQNVYYHYIKNMDVSSIKYDESTKYEKIRKQGKRTFVFFPFVIFSHGKYQNYEKWESDNYQEIIDTNIAKLIALWKAETPIESERRGADEWRIECAKFEIEKALEFKRLFGEKPTFHKMLTEQLMTEIALIIFVGGFVFVLFCIALKKSIKRE